MTLDVASCKFSFFIESDREQLINKNSQYAVIPKHQYGTVINSDCELKNWTREQLPANLFRLAMESSDSFNYF